MPLTLNEIRSRAHQFAVDWQCDTSERAEAQTFWNELLKVFGVDRKRVASFEKQIERLGKNTGRIDLFWPGLLLAEHKSAGEDLGKATIQAFEYLPGLKNRELPKYIMVSDFQRFKLFNLEGDRIDETSFLLKELPEKIELLSFLAGYTSKAGAYKDGDPINIEAAEKLGELYDSLKDNGYDAHSLKVFLVRLLFILFAEDTGIFDKDWFRWCIDNKTAEDGSDTGRFIIDLFAILDEPEGKRQKNLDEDLARFRYVNGSLFSENLRSPFFDAKARDLLLNLCGIRWNEVSPAIFGSLFQSAMDKEERRRLGAHYTSEKNILKLINGLFLDELKAELEKLLQDRSTRKKGNLEAFQQKLRSLRFLDPACGCGNFLVIAYRELRLLEIEVIKEIEAIEQVQSGGQLKADTALRSLVDVDQFYGIELEELPVQIARVALWLTDHQMNVQLAQETGLFHLRLPLKSEPHIIPGNALRMDWNAVIPSEELSYILGNPPFRGKTYLTEDQKQDIETVLAQFPRKGVLDYVTCWYVKALDLMKDTPIQCAFVSTNSITQGQQVSALWPHLLSNGFHFKFAHRTFKWKNEARGKAAVFVIIIGFSCYPTEVKTLFHYEDLAGEPLEVKARQISPYLVDMEPIIIDEIARPLTDAPPITNGSKPTDGGHLILTEDQKADFIREWPEAEPFIKPMIGSHEFINGYFRYCIWLHEVPPSQYRHIKGIMNRVELVRKFRAKSVKPATRRDANRPSVFAEIRQPKNNFIAVPEVSSERRLYLPCGYLSSDIIATNKLQMLKTDSLYHFGILVSLMHMAWMRQVCGRLKSDYDYSIKLVYNNFPWPESPSQNAIKAVEQAAQLVLKARSPHIEQGSILADLYDPNTMPVDLLKAHQALDKAVDACYGRKSFGSELERVKFLFELYKGLTTGNQQSLIPTEKPKRKTRLRKVVEV